MQRVLQGVLNLQRVSLQGDTKLTSINNLYLETRWEKLSDRRCNHRLILNHQILNVGFSRK